jgi:hypothetical protein
MKAALGTGKHHVDCLNLDILITSRAAYESRPNIKAKPQRLWFTYIVYATASSAVQVCRGQTCTSSFVRQIGLFPVLPLPV